MFKNRKRLQAIFLGFAGLLILTSVVLALIYFDVSFTSTSGSCSLSGTYTKKIYADGTYEWSPSRPSSATLSVSGTAEGLGNASVTLVSGHVNFSWLTVEVGGDKWDKRVDFSNSLSSLSGKKVLRAGALAMIFQVYL